MYIDVSEYQGLIDWKRVHDENDVKGIILRATTRNGKLDKRLIRNYNAILTSCSDVKELSVYKFSYSRTYAGARVEAANVLSTLHQNEIKFDYFYLDLEKFDDKDYTPDEAAQVILAYCDAFRNAGIKDKLRLYFNKNYLDNIIPTNFKHMPIWLARYNSVMGDVKGANVVLWQYTSTGKVNGISGNVDLSKEV